MLEMWVISGHTDLFVPFILLCGSFFKNTFHCFIVEQASPYDLVIADWLSLSQLLRVTLLRQGGHLERQFRESNRGGYNSVLISTPFIFSYIMEQQNWET